MRVLVRLVIMVAEGKIRLFVQDFFRDQASMPPTPDINYWTTRFQDIVLP